MTRPLTDSPLRAQSSLRIIYCLSPLCILHSAILNLQLLCAFCLCAFLFSRSFSLLDTSLLILYYSGKVIKGAVNVHFREWK